MKGFLIALAAIAVLGGGFAFMSYVGAYNYGNATEKLLDSIVDDNKNIYAITGKKVREVAQVPGMFKDDQVEVIKAAIEGRYGQDGAKQVFLMVKEMNPSLDSKLYIKIQEVMESSNNEFQVGQKRLIDVMRQYRTALDSFWRGMWLQYAGYPKIDIKSKKYVPISTADANSTFDSGIAEPIDLRAK